MEQRDEKRKEGTGEQGREDREKKNREKRTGRG